MYPCIAASLCHMIIPHDGRGNITTGNVPSSLAAGGRTLKYDRRGESTFARATHDNAYSERLVLNASTSRAAAAVLHQRRKHCSVIPQGYPHRCDESTTPPQAVSLARAMPWRGQTLIDSDDVSMPLRRGEVM